MHTNAAFTVTIRGNRIASLFTHGNSEEPIEKESELLCLGETFPLTKTEANDLRNAWLGRASDNITEQEVRAMI